MIREVIPRHRVGQAAVAPWPSAEVDSPLIRRDENTLFDYLENPKKYIPVRLAGLLLERTMKK